MSWEDRLIYLAAPWRRREEAREARQALLSAGLHCNSRWLDVATDASQTEEAENDFEDVYESDGFLLLNLEPSEGKNVELGIALGIADTLWNSTEDPYPIILVGPRTNVFHHHPAMTVVSTLEEALDHLKSA